MKHVLTAGVAALAIAATPVAAQTTSPSTPSTPPGASGTTTPGSNMNTGQRGQQGSTMGGQVTFQQAPTSGQVLVSDLMDANIYGSDGNSIGDINDVIIDRGGQVQAVVVGVGGFLGIGQKDVAVPFQSLQMSQLPSATGQPSSNNNTSGNWTTSNRLTLEVTRDQLRSAPEFRTTSSSTGSASSGTTGTSGTSSGSSGTPPAR